MARHTWIRQAKPFRVFQNGFTSICSRFIRWMVTIRRKSASFSYDCTSNPHNNNRQDDLEDKQPHFDAHCGNFEKAELMDGYNKKEGSSK